MKTVEKGKQVKMSLHRGRHSLAEWNFSIKKKNVQLLNGRPPAGYCSALYSPVLTCGGHQDAHFSHPAARHSSQIDTSACNVRGPEMTSYFILLLLKNDCISWDKSAQVYRLIWIYRACVWLVEQVTWPHTSPTGGTCKLIKLIKRRMNETMDRQGQLNGSRCGSGGH